MEAGRTDRRGVPDKRYLPGPQQRNDAMRKRAKVSKISVCVTASATVFSFSGCLPETALHKTC